MVKVLFVCMGNICRSPTAEGVFRHLVHKHSLTDLVSIDSAGTHAYHIGEPPDKRAQAAALQRGIDLSPLRARRVTTQEFEHFDYILAMDKDNMSILLEMAPPEHSHKVKLFMNYAQDYGLNEVPDPYYGGVSGFERVLDMVEAAADGLLNDIRSRHLK